LRTNPKFQTRQAPRFRLNHQIQASEMRVIDEEGKQMGLLKRQEAMQKAEELGVDLVEIAPNAKPPVAKLIDYNKFVYQQSKKKRLGKPTRSGDMKEVWLTPFIAAHDLASRTERGKELLAESGKLKVVMRFRRPQMSKRQFGEQVMKKFIEALGEVSLDKTPHFEGMRLVATISKK